MNVVAEARKISKYAAPTEIDSTLAALEAERDRLQRAIDAVDEQRARLCDIYDDRGGWTRAFLVNNTGGHVHSTTACSTCFATTSFMWLTDFSDKTEAELIEAAGERICTTCYPNAPVEARNRPSQFKSDEDVEREARAAERTEKTAVKAAKSITNPDGTPLVVGEGYRKETPSTERAARVLMGQRMADILLYRWNGETQAIDTTEGHPDENGWKADIQVLLAAITAKTGEDADALYAEALKKAKARTKTSYRKECGIQFDAELAAKSAGL
jgi:hypothetical protein